MAAEGLQLDPSEDVDRTQIRAILRAVIEPSFKRPPEDRVARALCCLLVRCANTWRSIDVLCQHAPETCAVDVAALVRAMIDAYLQAAFIFHDPARRAERAALYLDFEHVERYKSKEKALAHDNYVTRRILESPLRSEGERRLQEEYDRVKANYYKREKRADGTVKVGPAVRHLWYEGNLRSLAESVSTGDGVTPLAEYDFFVTEYNGAIHSSARALQGVPVVPSHWLLGFASCSAARIAKMSVEHNGIVLTESQSQFLDILAWSNLSE